MLILALYPNLLNVSYRQKTKAMIFDSSLFFRAYFIAIYSLYNIDFTTVLSDVKSWCIIQNGKIF